MMPEGERRKKPPDDQQREPSMAEDFRQFFFRGLAALLPALLTIALLVWAYNILDKHIGRHVTQGLISLCAQTMGEPQFVSRKDALKHGTPINKWDEQGRRLTVEYKTITHPAAIAAGGQEDHQEARKARNRALWRIGFVKYNLNIIGFLVAIIFVYFIGVFLTSLLGRTTWRITERALYRIPLVRAIYPNVKQVTDFLFTDRKLEFSGVVAVQYPRKGLWSVGLLTGPPMKTIEDSAGSELVTVFIPSSPTPVTGYVITIPREDTIELDITIDEALRFTISGGVIIPSAELTERERRQVRRRIEASEDEADGQE